MFGLRPRRNGESIEIVEVEYPVHTWQNPYCSDLSCPECHDNPNYHIQQTGAPDCNGQGAGSKTGPLGAEFDDDWFEAAKATLLAK